MCKESFDVATLYITSGKQYTKNMPNNFTNPLTFSFIVKYPLNNTKITTPICSGIETA